MYGYSPTGGNVDKGVAGIDWTNNTATNGYVIYDTAGALFPSRLLCYSLRVAWVVLGCSGEIGQEKGKFFGKVACPRDGLRRAPVTHHNDNKQESCVRQGSCFVIPAGTVCR